MLSERQRVSGALQMADTFRHDPQHAYFLQNQTFHSAIVDKEAPMLSLFVKYNFLNGGTKVLEPRDDAFGLGLAPVTASRDVDLEGGVKKQALRDIEALLKVSGESLMRATNPDEY
jgi:hypothetical protein